MTAVVGIRCTDGVVLGTDSAATLAKGQQQRTIEQLTEKLHVVDDRVLVAGTGSVGVGQRFVDIISDICEDEFYKNHDVDGLSVGRALSKAALEDLRDTIASKGLYGALVAFPCRKDLYLCEFDTDHFQPELKTLDGIWYASMGSSQHITDSFLGFVRNVFWRDEPPNVNLGQFAVTWTLDQAVALNPGGVKKPISIGVLEEDAEGGWPRARRLDADELKEIRVSISAAKDALREFPTRLSPEAAGDREVPEPTDEEAV